MRVVILFSIFASLAIGSLHSLACEKGYIETSNGLKCLSDVVGTDKDKNNPTEFCEMSSDAAKSSGKNVVDICKKSKEKIKGLGEKLSQVMSEAQSVAGAGACASTSTVRAQLGPINQQIAEAESQCKKRYQPHHESCRSQHGLDPIKELQTLYMTIQDEAYKTRKLNEKVEELLARTEASRTSTGESCTDAASSSAKCTEEQLRSGTCKLVYLGNEPHPLIDRYPENYDDIKKAPPTIAPQEDPQTGPGPGPGPIVENPVNPTEDPPPGPGPIAENPPNPRKEPTQISGGGEIRPTEAPPQLNDKPDLKTHNQAGNKPKREWHRDPVRRVQRAYNADQEQAKQIADAGQRARDEAFEKYSNGASPPPPAAYAQAKKARIAAEQKAAEDLKVERNPGFIPRRRGRAADSHSQKPTDIADTTNKHSSSPTSLGKNKVADQPTKHANGGPSNSGNSPTGDKSAVADLDPNKSSKDGYNPFKKQSAFEKSKLYDSLKKGHQQAQEQRKLAGDNRGGKNAQQQQGASRGGEQPSEVAMASRHPNTNLRVDDKPAGTTPQASRPTQAEPSYVNSRAPIDVENNQPVSLSYEKYTKNDTDFIPAPPPTPVAAATIAAYHPKQVQPTYGQVANGYSGSARRPSSKPVGYNLKTSGGSARPSHAGSASPSSEDYDDTYSSAMKAVGNADYEGGAAPKKKGFIGAMKDKIASFFGGNSDRKETQTEKDLKRGLSQVSDKEEVQASKAAAAPVAAKAAFASDAGEEESHDEDEEYVDEEEDKGFLATIADLTRKLFDSSRWFGKEEENVADLVYEEDDIYADLDPVFDTVQATDGIIDVDAEEMSEKHKTIHQLMREAGHIKREGLVDELPTLKKDPTYGLTH